jgi:hypothetical protein
MKTAPLPIILLDQFTTLGDELTDTLESRFGKRIRLRSFADADACLDELVPDAQVFILDYHSDFSDPQHLRRWKFFNTIRWADPKSLVTLLHSNGTRAEAKETMLKQISRYIIGKENGKYSLLHNLQPHQPFADEPKYVPPGDQKKEYRIRGYGVAIILLLLGIMLYAVSQM